MLIVGWKTIQKDKLHGSSQNLQLNLSVALQDSSLVTVKFVIRRKTKSNTKLISKGCANCLRDAFPF